MRILHIIFLNAHHTNAIVGLLLTVNPIIKDIMPDINQNMNKRVKQSLINILLIGVCRLNPKSNKDLFEYVQVFIETTGHMSRSLVSGRRHL